MEREIQYFDVFPGVVKAGCKTRITISPCGGEYSFEGDRCLIRIVPKEKREIERNRRFRILDDEFDEFFADIKDNKICFDYKFQNEQEYKILVNPKPDLSRDYTFSVYALNDDLYNALPYKGDLHMHSAESDGKGTISEVASAYRGVGCDFIVLTDHHKYESSVMLEKLYKDVNTGLKIFHGEEVHNCEMGYFHIVNFNGAYSINKILEDDYDNIFSDIKEKASKLDLPENINPVEFAFRKWITDSIRKSGGIAIFPHPYWTICDEYHTETDMSIYSLKQGIYDVFEILGGCKPEENNIQTALYNQLRFEGLDMPIVGSTDSHDFDAVNTAYTIVYTDTPENIGDAILNHKSVAVENLHGEHEHAFGDFRLVKYTLFLLRTFYPKYSEYTKVLNDLMCRYPENKELKNDIEAANEKAQSFKKRFFNTAKNV